MSDDDPEWSGRDEWASWMFPGSFLPRYEDLPKVPWGMADPYGPADRIGDYLQQFEPGADRDDRLDPLRYASMSYREAIRTADGTGFDPTEMSLEDLGLMYQESHTLVEIDTTEILMNSTLRGDLPEVPCEDCGESDLVGQVELDDGEPERSRVDCLNCGWGRGSDRIDEARPRRRRR